MTCSTFGCPNPPRTDKTPNLGLCSICTRTRNLAMGRKRAMTRRIRRHERGLKRPSWRYPTASVVSVVECEVSPVITSCCKDYTTLLEKAFESIDRRRRFGVWAA